MRCRSRVVEHHVHTIACGFDMNGFVRRRFVIVGNRTGIIFEEQRYLVFGQPGVADSIGKQHRFYFVFECPFTAIAG